MHLVTFGDDVPDPGRYKDGEGGPGDRVKASRCDTRDIAVARELRAEHEAVLPMVDEIRTVADALSTSSPDIKPARLLLGRLENELLPHERADEAALVPVAARALGGIETTAALSRTHAEIEHQISRLHRMLTGLADQDVASEDIIELRRLLYGLYAILRLHNAQEEEQAHSLIPDDAHGD